MLRDLYLWIYPPSPRPLLERPIELTDRLSSSQQRIVNVSLQFKSPLLPYYTIKIILVSLTFFPYEPVRFYNRLFLSVPHSRGSDDTEWDGFVLICSHCCPVLRFLFPE